MSYDKSDSMSVDFGARANREHINYKGCKLDLSETPPDAYEGFEHFNQYHICWHCGEQGHENGMQRNKLHYWVHIECEIYINELTKKL